MVEYALDENTRALASAMGAAVGAVDGKASAAKDAVGPSPFDFDAVGDGGNDDRPALIMASASGDMFRLPKPPVKYAVATPVTLSSSVLPDPKTSWAALTDSGKVDWIGGKTTPSGATIHRLTDRVFIGRAAPCFAGDSLTLDGGTSFFSNPANCPAYLPINSALVVESGPSQYAIAACVRTSEQSGVAGIGLGSAIVNDKSGGRSWGWIAEIQHEAGALNSNGFELAVKNKAGVSSTYLPYAPSPGVFGGRIVAGGDAVFGGPATAPNTAALIVIKNAEHGNVHGWNSGIVFTADALTGTTGAATDSGTAAAVVMARGHTVDWHAPVSGLGGRISSRVTDGQKGMGMFFADDAFVFQSTFGGAGALRIQHTPSAVNYLQINNSLAGAPVVLTAQGTDPNVNIRLTPKGAGRVQFGTLTAISDSPITGYIEIIDSTGNLRRLAVIS